MAQTSLYKDPMLSHARIMTTEETFAKGMSYTNPNQEDDFVKALVNFDIADSGEALRPRGGLSVAKVLANINTIGITDPNVVSTGMTYVYLDSTQDYTLCKYALVGGSKDGVALSTTALIIEHNDNFYTSPITFDRTLLQTMLLSSDTLYPTQALLGTTPKISSAHFCSLTEQKYNIVNTFVNGTVYVTINTAGVYTLGRLAVRLAGDSKLNWSIVMLNPKEIQPTQALNYGYNMLKTNPYSFSNVSTATTALIITGVIPYDEQGNLTLNAKIGEPLTFEMFYKYPLTDVGLKVNTKVYKNVLIESPQTATYTTAAQNITKAIPVTDAVLTSPDLISTKLIDSYIKNTDTNKFMSSTVDLDVARKVLNITTVVPAYDAALQKARIDAYRVSLVTSNDVDRCINGVAYTRTGEYFMSPNPLVYSSLNKGGILVAPCTNHVAVSPPSNEAYHFAMWCGMDTRAKGSVFAMNDTVGGEDNVSTWFKDTITTIPNVELLRVVDNDYKMRLIINNLYIGYDDPNQATNDISERYASMFPTATYPAQPFALGSGDITTNEVGLQLAGTEMGVTTCLGRDWVNTGVVWLTHINLSTTYTAWHNWYTHNAFNHGTFDLCEMFVSKTLFNSVVVDGVLTSTLNNTLTTPFDTGERGECGYGKIKIGLIADCHSVVDIDKTVSRADIRLADAYGIAASESEALFVRNSTNSYLSLTTVPATSFTERLEADHGDFSTWASGKTLYVYRVECQYTTAGVLQYRCTKIATVSNALSLDTDNIEKAVNQFFDQTVWDALPTTFNQTWNYLPHCIVEALKRMYLSYDLVQVSMGTTPGVPNTDKYYANYTDAEIAAMLPAIADVCKYSVHAEIEAYTAATVDEKYMVQWEIESLTSNVELQVLQQVRKSKEYNAGERITLNYTPAYAAFALIAKIYKKSVVNSRVYTTDEDDARYLAPEYVMTMSSNYLTNDAENANMSNAKIVTYPLGSAKGMCTWAQRAVLWGVDGAKTTLFVSEPNSANYFPYPNNCQVFIDEIVKCVNFKSDLLVFTKSSLHQLTWNADGVTYAVKCIQTRLDMDVTDSDIIMPVQNMVYFKSNNAYYMVVPNSASLTGELQLAPVSKPVSNLFVDFLGNIKTVLNNVYNLEALHGEYTVELADYCDYLVGSKIRNTYKVKLVFDTEEVDGVITPTVYTYADVTLQYDTVTRAWNLLINHANSSRLTLYNSAVTGGTKYISLPQTGNNLNAELISYSTANLTDGLTVTSVGFTGAIKNYQYLETGTRKQYDQFKKRFREVQFMVNTTNNLALEFHTGFNVDDDERRRIYGSHVTHITDPNDPAYGTVIVEPDVFLEPNNETSLDENRYLDTNNETSLDENWYLDTAKFPNNTVSKVRFKVSGKGYGGNVKILSTNAIPFEILNINWVYRVMFPR